MKPLQSNPLDNEGSYLSLASISQALNSSKNSIEVGEAIGRRAAAISQADACAVFLKNSDEGFISPWSVNLSTGFVQQVLAAAAQSPRILIGANSGPVIIADSRRYAAASPLTSLAQEEGYRSVHIWPLIVHGKFHAAIGCFYQHPHALKKADYRAMATFTSQAGNTLESIEKTSGKPAAAFLSGMYDLSRQLVRNDTLDIQLDRFVRSAVEIVQVSFCRVITLEQDGQYICQAVYPARGGSCRGEVEPQAAQLVYQRIAHTEEPFLLHRNDVTLGQDARLALELDQAHTLCVIPLRMDAELVGLLILGEQRRSEHFHIEKVRQARIIADLASSVVHRERLYHRLEESYLETILALTRSLEARDPYTAGHSLKIVELMEKIGRRLGVAGDRLQALRWAGLLHDIGKIGVPDEILRRPGPLSPEEWVIMREHPRIGADIISPISSLTWVAPLILAHHERFDGKGYPNHLRGEDIPLEARILTVVDAYCAMTDGRVYRPAKSHSEAVTELRACAGSHFDPLVVDVFLSLID